MSNNIGILCHITSLESNFGIGDFGQSSKDFIDFLSKHNIKVWQILPLNETNIYNCPYSSNCFFSYDPMFLDVEQLVSLELINKEEISGLYKLSKSNKIKFKQIKQEKRRLLHIAFNNLDQKYLSNLQQYSLSNPHMLRYATFKILLKYFNTNNWRDLNPCYRNVESPEYISFVEGNYKSILEELFIQYILEQQWLSIRNYATNQGITILGDIPIYPDPNSFDVFDCPEYYKLDQTTLNPLKYGGVPADDFCKDGQNWHTCIYHWDVIAKNNYHYMINKIQLMLQRYDLLRLDHFMGYVNHYEISALDENVGNWVAEGGEDFFEQLSQIIDFKKLTVEDLGIVTQNATDIIKKYNLKNMCVLQLSLTQDENEKYLPENVPVNCIYYTGTHDNNTLVGYIQSLDKDKLQQFKKLLHINANKPKQIAVECIQQVLSSKSNLKIFPIQDLLLQDEKSRMNIPGKTEGCWEYKLPKNYQKILERNLSLFNI